jgi:predicted SAM-dependent methyltransferase
MKLALLQTNTMPAFLHVGCGTKHKNATTRGFDSPDWTEWRVDIDPRVKPDWVGSMTHMPSVANASMDAVFSSHNLEHLNAHEVPLALQEFLRVLTPSGFLVLTCPDLQAVAALIAEDQLMQPAYTSAAGPITPLDMVFGLQTAIANGNHHMAHRCGFTQKVLTATLKHAGFASILAVRRPKAFDLWVIASKSDRNEAALRALAEPHFPLVITADKTAARPQAAS